MEVKPRMCPSCSYSLEHDGKRSDFFDDYSPYQEIEGWKKEETVLYINHNVCYHLYHCPYCGNEHELPVRQLYDELYRYT